MSRQRKADLLMIVVTIGWGSSYLFMKMGLESLQAFTLISLRFGIAFVLAGLIFYSRLIKTDRRTLFYAFVLGSLLFGVFAAILFGIKSTSVANAGFLVSLTVIFVPLFSALFFRTALARQVWGGVGLALTGIGLMTLNAQASFHVGDALCIAGAVFYALHILVTGRLTARVDSITLGVLQLGFTAAWGFLFAAALEEAAWPGTAAGWYAVLALSIVCSAFGFIAQTAAQRYTTPIHTGLIFSLEPVFAALFAFWFAGEILSFKGYLGAAMVLAGVLVSEAKQIRFKRSS